MLASLMAPLSAFSAVPGTGLTSDVTTITMAVQLFNAARVVMKVIGMGILFVGGFGRRSKSPPKMTKLEKIDGNRWPILAVR